MLPKPIQSIIRTCYDLSIYRLETGVHITRYYMYRRIATLRSTRSSEERVLSISHSESLAELLGYSCAQITNIEYPNANLLQLPFENEAFDAVVSDQVLAHVQGSPSVAIREAYRVLKTGGIALHTTCFINPIDNAPNDYWRFSPQGLELLAAEGGEIVDVGGWGNPYVWFFCSLGLRFVPIPHADWHPAHMLATTNRDEWPIVTWVCSRKQPERP